MSQLKSASRLVFSRCCHATGTACLNAVCWLVWTALAISAGLMTFVHFRREITLPDFALRRLEKELRGAQLRAEFGRTHLDLQGVLLLEDVRVFGEGIADPLVEARAIRVEFSPWMLAIGHVDPHQIVIDGGRLNCPAPLSPTGVAEPVISELRLHADRRSRSWSVSSADWFVGTLRVHSTLEIDDSVVRPSGAEPEAPILARLLRTLRQAAGWLPELNRVEQPRLDLLVRELSAAKFDLRGELSVGRVHGLEGFTAEAIALATEISGTSWTHPAEFPVQLTCRTLLAPHEVRVEGVTVNTRVKLPWTGEGSLPRQATVSADAVTWADYRVTSPLLRVERLDAQSLRAAIDLTFGGELLSVSGTGNVPLRTAEVDLHARLAEADLNALTIRGAEWRRSNFLSRLSFQSFAEVRSHLTLAPGWKLSEAKAAVYVPAATSSEIPLREVSAEIVLDEQRLEVAPLILRQGESEVRGSYGMDLKTHDYRFLLKGNVFPERISGWFKPSNPAVTDWWPRLWRDFTFHDVHPLADVDVRGRWAAPELTVVCGRMVAHPLTLRGVPLEHADVTFFIRPEHYDIVRFDARRGEQYAVGTFTRRDDPDTHEPRRIDFDFESNLPLAEGAVFFGPEGRTTIEPYQFERPPHVDARGRIDFRDGVAREAIDARVRSLGEFRFNGFPLRNARFNFTLRNNDIDLPELEADLADGKLTGRATVTGPSDARRLWFAGKLAHADLARTVKTWNEFRAGSDNAAAAAHSSSVASNLGTHGRLDLDVDATGPIDDLMALRGTGRTSIVGAELGQVQMLGFLSRLLQGSIFGFTSLRFTNAEAQFTIEKEVLNFSKLTFTGPSSRLEGKGSYRMSDELLDFRVVLRPFRESDSALGVLVGLVLEPIASVLRVRLTGTLSQPDWSFVAGPTNFFRHGDRPATPNGAPPNTPTVPPLAPLFPAPAPTPTSAPGAIQPFPAEPAKPDAAPPPAR